MQACTAVALLCLQPAGQLLMVQGSCRNALPQTVMLQLLMVKVPNPTELLTTQLQ
jgi:hypothetical protein